MRKRNYFLIFLLVLLFSLTNRVSYANAIALEKEKVIYLTFDDGPSPNNTPKILNILKRNNVKASFFVIGVAAESNTEVVKNLHKEGMAVLPHSYLHDYRIIYSSADKYFEDLQNCINTIKRITGTDPFPYTRLPGGSDNQVSSRETLRTIRNKLNAKGIDYVDWNMYSGDADEEVVAINVLDNNIKNQSINTNLAVILMHDSYYKTTTADSLDKIIKDLKAKGYIFKTLDQMSISERTSMIKMGIINRR